MILLGERGEAFPGCSDQAGNPATLLRSWWNHMQQKEVRSLSAKIQRVSEGIFRRSGKIDRYQNVLRPCFLLLILSHAADLSFFVNFDLSRLKCPAMAQSVNNASCVPSAVLPEAEWFQLGKPCVAISQPSRCGESFRSSGSLYSDAGRF